MKLNTRGIVIRVSPYGESNRLITILTSDLGVIKAFVFGAAGIKNKNNTATSLLSYSNFSLTKTGDTYRVDEASAIEIFYGLRSDIVLSSLAQYFCELFSCFAPEEADANDYLRLILNSLALLCKNEKDIRLIKFVTELYIMKLCGYMPEVSSCAECGEDSGPMYFNSDEGLLMCENCAVNRSIRLSVSSIDAMRYVLSVPFESIYSFTVPNESLMELSKATEQFVLIRAERRFKTLDFFHSVQLSF